MSTEDYWAGFSEGLEIGATVGPEGVKAAAMAVGWLPSPAPRPRRRSGERRPHPHLRLMGGAA